MWKRPGEGRPRINVAEGRGGRQELGGVQTEEGVAAKRSGRGVEAATNQSGRGERRPK